MRAQYMQTALTLTTRYLQQSLLADDDYVLLLHDVERHTLLHVIEQMRKMLWLVPLCTVVIVVNKIRLHTYFVIQFEHTTWL